MNRSAFLPAVGLFLLIGAAYAPTRRRGFDGLGADEDEPDEDAIRVTDIPDAPEPMVEKVRRRQGLPPLRPEPLPEESESVEVIDLESAKKGLTPYKMGVLLVAMERKAQGLPLSKNQQKLYDDALAASRRDPFPTVYRAEPEPQVEPEIVPSAPKEKSKKKVKAAGSKPTVPAPVPVPPMEERAPSAAREAAMEREAPKTPKVVEPAIPPRRAIPVKVTKNDLIAVQQRRHAARKLYGTFVLSTQGADSMIRVARKTNVEESKAIADSLYSVARVALRKARELDANYIEAQCSRPEGVPCPT